MRDRIVLRDAQIGTLVSIAGRFTVVDHVSRPEVYAALHGPRVQGYALDALEQTRDAPAPTVAAAEAFVRGICERRVFERDGIGLGREARFEGGGVAGAALIAGSELVQLTAFADEPSDPADPAARRIRIRRPSRRRTA
jgi:hypothetical protein